MFEVMQMFHPAVCPTESTDACKMSVVLFVNKQKDFPSPLHFGLCIKGNTKYIKYFNG